MIPEITSVSVSVCSGITDVRVSDGGVSGSGVGVGVVSQETAATQMRRNAAAVAASSGGRLRVATAEDARGRPTVVKGVTLLPSD